MNSILKPAIALMGRVSYPIKFGLIFMVFLIPLVIGGGNLISPTRDYIDLLESERAGLAVIKTIRQPMEHVQQHRGMMAAYLTGDTNFQEKILEKRKVVDGKFKELRAVDEKLGEQLKTANAVNALLKQWEHIKTTSMSVPVDEAIETHNALIAEMLSLIDKVADTSHITLDPNLDSYYMGNALVLTLPRLLENMGQARAVGTSVAESASLNAKDFTKLTVLSNNITLYFNSSRSGLSAAFENNVAIGKGLKVPTDVNNNAIRTMQALLKDQLLDAKTITVSADKVYAASSQAISDSYALYDAMVPVLDQLFVERIKASQTTIRLTISIIVGVLVFLAWLFAGFYFSIRQSIVQISDAAEKLAKGDLTVHVVLSSHDEMTQLADSFNAMASSFSQVVSKISGSTQKIGNSSEALSAIIEQSRQSIFEQQTQTKQVAVAMDDMTATVQDVSDNITDTAQAAEQASSATDQGRKMVEDAVQAVQQLADQFESASSVIHQLEQDSENINAVLEVIKGVAEQTNLLALNAAIEAARAGEHGRGFAVVADEVRTLAGRTQESTAEINQVIDKLQTGSRKAVEVMSRSNDEARGVIEKATLAGESLATISTEVERINKMSNQIASAAEQQSASTKEISFNISSITDMANESAAGAEKTASASEDLAQLGTELQGLLTQFKV